MKLLLVRHAKSIANHLGIRQDKNKDYYDTNLHDLGLLQAKEIAQRLKNEKIDIIYSSPLKRAKETAEEINKYHKIEIIYDKKIEERRVGETKLHFLSRCIKFFNKVKKQDKTILVVTHNGVILTLMAISTQNRKKGGELVRKVMNDISNTSLTIIEKQDKRFNISLIGDVTHRSDKNN